MEPTHGSSLFSVQDKTKPGDKFLIIGI